jgi:hypothetical protein
MEEPSRRGGCERHPSFVASFTRGRGKRGTEYELEVEYEYDFGNDEEVGEGEKAASFENCTPASFLRSLVH